MEVANSYILAALEKEVPIRHIYAIQMGNDLNIISEKKELKQKVTFSFFVDHHAHTRTEKVGGTISNEWHKGEREEGIAPECSNQPVAAAKCGQRYLPLSLKCFIAQGQDWP